MWRFFVWMIPGVSKDRGAVTFKDQLPLKMKETPFETSAVLSNISVTPSDLAAVDPTTKHCTVLNSDTKKRRLHYTNYAGCSYCHCCPYLCSCQYTLSLLSRLWTRNFIAQKVCIYWDIRWDFPSSGSPKRDGQHQQSGCNHTSQKPISSWHIQATGAPNLCWFTAAWYFTLSGAPNVCWFTAAWHFTLPGAPNVCWFTATWHFTLPGAPNVRWFTATWHFTLPRSHLTMKPTLPFYFYRCTVHFEGSLITTHQQMH
jgi:hypothetical protein